MNASNDTLSNPANFMPPMQISLLCVSYTLQSRRWHADFVKIAEFRSDCDHTKCFFSGQTNHKEPGARASGPAAWRGPEPTVRTHTADYPV